MSKIYRKTDLKHFDVIGDIHGCYNELAGLLAKLGYSVDRGMGRISGVPEDRRLVFLGDFTDRGPEPVKVLRLAMDAVETGFALSVRGNHEEKILQKLIKNTPAKEEVMETLDAIRKEGEEFVGKVKKFIADLPYVILCGECVIIAHAGLKEEFQDVETRDPKRLGKIKSLTIYGDITGKKLPDGRPERLDWASSYRGELTVIYGHSIIAEAVWRNNTINIDTGCFETGILTAVRMPEKDIVDNIRGHCG